MVQWREVKPAAFHNAEMSKYLEQIAEAVIDVLHHAAHSRDHRILGYVANVDFWVAEIEHCVLALDGFPTRQNSFNEAVRSAVHEVREDDFQLGRRVEPTKLYYGEATTEAQSEHYLESVAKLRDRVEDSARKFLGRLRNEKLLPLDKWAAIDARLPFLKQHRVP